jgi:hypothetical protein
MIKKVIKKVFYTEGVLVNSYWLLVCYLGTNN